MAFRFFTRDEIITEKPFEMAFVEDDDVIQTLPMNPELLKFAHNTRRAPGRIGLSHLSNEAPQLRRDRWATTATHTTQPTPVVAEAFVSPRLDCPRLNKEQGLALATPHSRNHRPEQPITR